MIFLGELMFGDADWFVSRTFGGQGGIFFTDWWSSPDNSRYFPTRPPQQVPFSLGSLDRE